MERRNFLKSAGAAGVAAVGMATAGCLGGENTEQAPQPGDEPIVPKDPGWFGVDGTVLEQKTPDNLKITESSLFRTPDGFGVLGTVKNTGNQAYVRVQIHAQMTTGGNEVIGNGVAGFTETEAVDDLGAGEIWHWRIEFEDTDPDTLFQANDSSQGNDDSSNDNVNYQLWATGNIQ